jgi:hypothetical protein
MKNHLRLFSLLAFFLVAAFAPSIAQNGECITDGCAFNTGGTQRPATAVSTTSSIFAPIATNFLPGDFAVCNVVTGVVYEWSLCPVDGGTAAFDAQLTLFDAQNAELCYSDDVCGLNPKIRYTADFTGTVKIQVNVFDCVNTGGSAATLVWRAIDPNLNDVAVAEVYTYTRKLIPNGNPHVVSAAIRNNGSQAVPFLEVALNVSGANTYTGDAVITNLAPNETRVVEFEGFSSSASGNNVITVSVNEPDDVPANNTKSVTQDANSTTYSYRAGTTAATGLGFTGAANGEIAAKFINTGQLNIAQVNIFFNGANTAHRIKIYDATGPNGTPGTQLFFSAANRNSTAGLNQIQLSPAVAVDGDFWVAVVQQTTTFVNIGVENEAPPRPGRFFFKASGAGATWTDIATTSLAYRYMFGVIAACSPPAAPAAILGPATVCQTNPTTYSVEPVPGATSYQWVLPSGWTGTSNTASITVTPGANGGNLGARAVSACGPSSPTIRAITVTPAPAASFNYPAATFCLNRDPNPVPTSATPGTYSATPTGLVFVSNTTGEINLAASTPGNYVVTLTVNDGSGCEGLAVQNVTLQVCTGISPDKLLTGIQAFPVPASQELFITSGQTDLSKANIVLVSADGRIYPTSGSLNRNKDFVLKVGQLPRGLFKLRVIAEGKSWTSNIVLD